MDGRTSEDSSLFTRVDSDSEIAHSDVILSTNNYNSYQKSGNHTQNPNLTDLQNNFWLWSKKTQSDFFRQHIRVGKLLLNGKSFLSAPENASINDQTEEEYIDNAVDQFVKRELFNNNKILFHKYHKILIAHYHSDLPSLLTSPFDSNEKNPTFVAHLYSLADSLWLEITAYQLSCQTQPMIGTATSSFKFVAPFNKESQEEAESGFKLVTVKCSNNEIKKIAWLNRNPQTLFKNKDPLSATWKIENEAIQFWIKSHNNEKLSALAQEMLTEITTLHLRRKANSTHYAILVFIRKLLENSESDHTSLLAFKQLKQSLTKSRFRSNTFANKMKRFLREYEYQEAVTKIEKKVLLLKNSNNTMAEEIERVLTAIKETKNKLKKSTARCVMLTEIMNTLFQLLNVQQTLVSIQPPQLNDDEEEEDDYSEPREAPDIKDKSDTQEQTEPLEDLKGKLIAKLFNQTLDISRYPWGHLVKGALCLFLGTLILASCIAFAAATWGGGVPISIAGGFIGTGLIITGIATVASAVSLAPAIKGGILFFKAVTHYPPKAIKEKTQALITSIKAAPAA